MPKIRYSDAKIRPSTLATIVRANEIIAEYQRRGFDLTLRQLYYQFVARGFIENSEKSYTNLGTAITAGRLGGLIDWEAIVDRTRGSVAVPHWRRPHDIISGAAEAFRIDKWAGQPYRPEIWIEKEALAGIFEGVCAELDVTYLCCRGYTSISEMWQSAMRLRGYARRGQTPVILHFGDHDPSGMDMTRDVGDRLRTFMGGLEVKRLALNMDQIEEFSPPPNPTKYTDSRAQVYIQEFGEESWELDALDPDTLAGLVRDSVEELRDDDLWEERLAEEEGHRQQLASAAVRWDGVAAWLRDTEAEE